MEGIILPEVTIYNITIAAIVMLRRDLDSVNENESILYKLFGLDQNGKVQRMNQYNFFKQAKKIVMSPENFKVNFGYAPEVANNINLHILLPSENSNGGIGFDEGYQENSYVNVYESNYQIMITGSNSSEVNLAYNILKSLFTMLYEQFELNGLRLPKFSGNDIVMQDDLTPVPLFHKVINISFTYELVVPIAFKGEVMKKFVFEIDKINDFVQI
nr:MAG TPA: hypothetical protein [Caudoviricetes sp.]